MARPQQKPKQEPKRPVVSFGPYPTDRNTSVEVAVWSNEIEVESGTVETFNVTTKRSYRDTDGNWHTNANLRPHDIPVLIHALSKAHDYVLERKNPNGEQL